MTKEGLMRMVVCAGLALTASVMIAGRCAQVSSAALPAQQQGDKPVEQTRKNIKGLKGLPESQLFPLMNFIYVSLAASGHEAGPAPRPSPPGAPTPAPTREALPTVQQVFDKYVAAVGGQEAASKFQTQVVKGTRDASQARSWPFEATSNGPDKFLMVVQVPQFGTVSQAVNGGAGG